MALTAGQLLTRIMAERKLGKSQFAREVTKKTGKPCAYHNVYRWMRDKEFTPDNRERAALTLGLAADYFDAPEKVDRRSVRARQELEMFIATPAAQLIPEYVTAYLRDLPFDRHPRIGPPNPRFYAILAELLQWLGEDVDDASKGERTPSDKSASRRRRRHPPDQTSG